MFGNRRNLSPSVQESHYVHADNNKTEIYEQNHYVSFSKQFTNELTIFEGLTVAQLAKNVSPFIEVEI
jgi:hypothetical protein